MCAEIADAIEQRVTPMGGGEPYTWSRKGMPYPKDQDLFCRKDDGFRGMWYGCTKVPNEYVYKYSGGLGTYCAKHRSLAVRSREVGRTYFVWGGTSPEGHTLEHTQWGPRRLWHMISYYDHATGNVKRPTILLDKWTGDCHDNPVMSMDPQGYIYVFSPSHGKSTGPSYIHKSVEPYSIDRFETVATTLFAYPQPWYQPGRGFVMMHTQYKNWQRWLAVTRSEDGVNWGPSEFIAHIEKGQYQVSNSNGARVVTAFNYHPDHMGLERRSNLYVMASDDMGRTWRTLDGREIQVPLTKSDNPALVVDSESQKRLVYLKDLTFDREGNPVALYITSNGHVSGPQNDPRIWTVSHWTGAEWVHHEITRSDNNYDMGSLYIEDDGTWRLIAPTETGPQAFNPGGEMAMWTSDDAGATWRKARQMTHDSPRNHTYARRPVDAHPDFYAYWADGHGRQPSVSRLYFANRRGDVFRLPMGMTGEFARPERVE